MDEELITKENLTKEMLKEVFEAAYMDVDIDEDGDICVNDSIRCYLYLPKSHDRILMWCSFGTNEEATIDDCLRAANLINKHYAIVKCYVNEYEGGRSFRFNYDVMIGTGLTRRSLVQIVRRYCSIPRTALSEYASTLM